MHSFEVYLIEVTDSNKDKTANELLQSASVDDRIATCHSCSDVNCANNTTLYTMTGTNNVYTLPTRELNDAEYFLLFAINGLCTPDTAQTHSIMPQVFELRGDI